jgi:hypothetical protein
VLDLDFGASGVVAGIALLAREDIVPVICTNGLLLGRFTGESGGEWKKKLFAGVGVSSWVVE